MVRWAFRQPRPGAQGSGFSAERGGGRGEAGAGWSELGAGIQKQGAAFEARRGVTGVTRRWLPFGVMSPDIRNFPSQGAASGAGCGRPYPLGPASVMGRRFKGRLCSGRRRGRVRLSPRRG